MKRTADVLNEHRPGDDRSEAGTPMCSCGHDLGWDQTWGEHVAQVIDAFKGHLRIELDERRNEPTRCQVWRHGVLVFDGLEKGAFAQTVEFHRGGRLEITTVGVDAYYPGRGYVATKTTREEAKAAINTIADFELEG